MTKGNWQRDLTSGKAGEAIAAHFLSTLGFAIDNVSDDADYQKQDIDFIATKGKEVMKVEVKTDSKMNSTGNVVLELITNVASGKQGWFNITKSTHIFFIDAIGGCIHAVRTDELKELYENHKLRFRHIRQQQLENGCFYKEAYIALVPVAELKKLPHYNYIKEEFLR